MPTSTPKKMNLLHMRNLLSAFLIQGLAHEVLDKYSFFVSKQG